MSIANILVVEDEAIVAANIEMRLQSLGYSVPAVVDSGPEALDAINTLRPDLVLMDIRIAGPIDGISTAELIRDQHAIPVIYLTAYTDDETVQRARQTEPYGYILKPFEVSELRTAIELALYRHMVEREQHAREQWFSTTLRSISDAVITTDTQGHISFMNPAAEELTGWRLEDALSRRINTVLTLVDEASQTLLDDPVMRVLRERSLQAGEARAALVLCQGRAIPVESRAACIQDDRGDLLGAAVVLRDLRERRAIEQQLRLIEAAVQQVEEIALVLTHDPKGYESRVVFVNRSFTRLLGYTAEEVIGRGIDVLYGRTSKPDLLEEMRQGFAKGQAIQGEGSIYRKNGGSFYAEWNLSPLRDPYGAITHWVGMLRDVTRRRRDQELRWQRQKLESLGVLAGGIAHDFNNLMAVVLGNASIAMLELAPDSPVRDLLQPIEVAARRAADLTRQMLAYAGHDRLSTQSFDLNALVRDTSAELADTLPPKVELRVQAAPELPMVIGDMAQIRRVLRSLITNAYEAIGTGSGLIQLSTGVRRFERDEIATTYLAPELPAGEYLTISVEDTGAGMDAETLTRAFEPFYSTKFAGRGLGLAEVLGIVSAHQGAVKLESTVNHGTTCTVLLPVGGQSGFFLNEPAMATQPRTADYSAGGRGLLLLVDDDIARTESTARNLEQAGYAVLVASDTQGVADILRVYRGMVDCVLLDAGLPDGESQMALDAIRKVRSRTPILLLADQRTPTPAEPLAANVYETLVRPCHAKEIEAAVERALA